MTPRYASATCPHCGHEHEVLIDKRGESSARAAARVGISFHVANCSHNPNRSKSERESTPILTDVAKRAALLLSKIGPFTDKEARELIEAKMPGMGEFGHTFETIWTELTQGGAVVIDRSEKGMGTRYAVSSLG